MLVVSYDVFNFVFIYVKHGVRIFRSPEQGKRWACIVATISHHHDFCGASKKSGRITCSCTIDCDVFPDFRKFFFECKKSRRTVAKNILLKPYLSD